MLFFLISCMDINLRARSCPKGALPKIGFGFGNAQQGSHII
jgi:hypothetical protein